MGFFDLFKKKKKEHPKEELQWNKMWDMWAKKKSISPYAELMTYESEINNGGHSQFFFNVSNSGDLAKTVAALYTVLPDNLKQNLEKAYQAYLESGDETSDELFYACDNVFYENESEVEKILKGYASLLEL